MKIAVASDTATMEGPIPPAFEPSGYLLIVETDDGTFEAFENPDGTGGSGMAMAREVVRRNCEALISGTLESEAFEELSGAQVTRYLAAGLEAGKALELMDMNRLDLIRVPNGEAWVPHDHSRGECNCGEDHEHE